jgi:hypothetical protein
MHLPARFSALFVAAALTVCAATASSQTSSSSQTPDQVAAPPAQTTGQGTYIAINPLAGVRYDNKWDVSVGMAYRHIKAGPTVLQGANLGGFNASASRFLSPRWRLEGSVRGSYGTSGIGNVNPVNQKGPFISEYLFTAGPEFLGPHNAHGAIYLHALAGGAYGDFEGDLHGITPQGTPQNAQSAGFYNTQVAPAAIIGGHIDLNRSARWVFRITPDAVMTHYGINYPPNNSQFDVNFAISVGLQYKFLPKKR